MTIRQDLADLPALTNPTEGETLFIVADSSVEQTLTVARARTLLATQGDAGPQGPTGYTGSQGIQGIQGYAGSVGPTGPQGPQGFAGSQGFTGSRGDTGYTGSRGDLGYTGSKGFAGSQGFTGSASTVPGPQGPSGYVGSQGYAGSRGYTGSAAENANTSTNLAGGAAGSIPIQSANSSTAFIPIGPSGYVLVSQGTTATWVSTSTIVPATAGQAGKVFVNTLTNADSTTYYPTVAIGPGDYVPLGVNDGFTFKASTGVLTAPKLVITTSTDSFSTTTGALVVAGGAGIGGTLWSGEHYITYDSSTGTYPAGYDAGLYIENTGDYITGITIANNANQKIFLVNTSGTFYLTQATAAGGVDPFTNVPLIIATPTSVRIPLLTASTGTSTGALTLGGGLGVDGDIYFSGNLFQNGVLFTGGGGDRGYSGSVGYTGSQGYAGSAGYTGSQGDKGFTGSQGYTGSQGDLGYTGSQGELGYTGSQGELGYTGSQGEIGYTGSIGDLGYTGSQGDLGYTGSASTATGYTGSQGIPGTPGTSVTIVGSTSTSTLLVTPWTGNQ